MVAQNIFVQNDALMHGFLTHESKRSVKHVIVFATHVAKSVEANSGPMNWWRDQTFDHLNDSCRVLGHPWLALSSRMVRVVCTQIYWLAVLAIHRIAAVGRCGDTLGTLGTQHVK